MEMKPSISVIVPIYKTEPYLDRCVRSILEQTLNDFELILVDDGSPDRCPEICDTWQQRDSRIRVIHQRNLGASSARNRGLQAASGRYIGFVDSDDWIERDMYQALYSAITENQADLAICNLFMDMTANKHRRDDSQSSEISSGIMGRRKDKGVGRTEYWDRTFLLDRFFRIHGEDDTHSICNYLIRSDILKGYRFPVGMMNEDVDLNYYLALNCSNAVYVPRKLYHYCRNRMGVTNSQFSMKKLDLLDIWDGIEKRVKHDAPEYVQPCQMNSMRARFTLLSQMVLYGYDREDPKMRETKKQLKAEVRSSYGNLMRWRMPLSRKILLTLVIL